MRARVHDVIGQRLSILHRYLEEGRLDDESLEQIDPLLRSISDDLRSGGDSEPAEQLGDIIHAFGLVSVQIDVEGRFPRTRVSRRPFADYPRGLDQRHQARAGPPGPCAPVAGGVERM